MEKKNQYMEVSYQLFVDGEQGQELMEETTKEQPFQWITGFGYALDAFENQLVNLERGQPLISQSPRNRLMVNTMRNMCLIWIVKCFV